MSIPVIVGGGQAVQRPGSVPLDQALGPIELMVEAARVAAEDAGTPALLARVGWIGVAGGWWRHQDPGALVASALGAQNARTALAAISGTAPQDLLALAAERIATGELDVALVLGGEAEWSARRLQKAGQEPTWAVDAGTRVPIWNAGEGPHQPEGVGGFPAIVRREGRVFGAAATAYALFEDSLRCSSGRTVDEQRDVAAALVSRFSQVASGNPFAWDRTAHSAQVVREATADNRMVAFPYTKAMVANNTVDMASAVLLCSRDIARSVGISEDRLVYPYVVASSHEAWEVGRRPVLHGSPGLAAAGRAAFEHTGLSPGDVAHVDLYACFPAIVQMSTAALGLDPDRQLTLTGGLVAAGAPVGNATGQSLAAMVAAARDGGVALVHGNGGNATKHCVGLYGVEPPAAGFRRIACPDDEPPGDLLPEGWHGQVTVEAATVIYDREGPVNVFAAVRGEAGRRGFATSVDGDLLDAAHRADLTGRQLMLTSSGGLHG